MLSLLIFCSLSLSLSFVLSPCLPLSVTLYTSTTKLPLFQINVEKDTLALYLSSFGIGVTNISDAVLKLAYYDATGQLVTITQLQVCTLLRSLNFRFVHCYNHSTSGLYTVTITQLQVCTLLQSLNFRFVHCYNHSTSGLYTVTITQLQVCTLLQSLNFRFVHCYNHSTSGLYTVTITQLQVCTLRQRE